MNLLTFSNGTVIQVETWFNPINVHSKGKLVNMLDLVVGDQVDDFVEEQDGVPVTVEKIERF